jgi:Cd2+/Zn2+-exporting ATPase
MDDDLTKIASAIRISKKTMQIVRGNIVFILGVKFSVLALAMFGLAGMWAAVFADVGVSMIALANSARLLGMKNI